MKHESFEWDPQKAIDNLSKHLVSFEEAVAMLTDPFAERFQIDEYDEKHSTDSEDRWKTTGSYPFDRNRVFRVIWTRRTAESGLSATRIISVRHVSPRERSRYEESIAHE